MGLYNEYKSIITFSIGLIVKLIDHEAVYKSLCPQFPAKLIKSPFPGERDNNPSFGFYFDDKWKWKQLATGDQGDVIDFVKKMFNFDNDEVMEFLCDHFLKHVDFDKLYRDQVTYANRGKRSSGTKTVVVGRPWQTYDNDYWIGRYGITPSIIKHYNGFGALETWVHSQKTKQLELLWVNTPMNPMYAFYFPVRDRVKIYRPLEPDKKRKHIGNVQNGESIKENEVLGLAQCRFNRNYKIPIIITKALKEVMFYRKYGIDAFSLNGEGHHMPDWLIDYLKIFASRILIFLDNDMPGIKASMSLQAQLPWADVFRTGENDAKNITDVFEFSSESKAISIIKEIGFL